VKTTLFPVESGVISGLLELAHAAQASVHVNTSVALFNVIPAVQYTPSVPKLEAFYYAELVHTNATVRVFPVAGHPVTL
jgi:hypothetical protein